MIPRRLLDRLCRQAGAERWHVSAEAFASALEASVSKSFSGTVPSGGDLERYLKSLHLEDLALAVACAGGDEEAWGHFVLEYRPALYRAVDAIDPGGGSRDLADSLYAELFGLDARAGERQPLFRYFHGRSSLATWLHAILTQRHIDRLRSRKHTTELPEDDSSSALVAAPEAVEPERQRFVALMRKALAAAVALLTAKDRLRLSCYYAQELTLAQTGGLLGEHEATVSRQLAKSRKAIRQSVEQQLRSEHGLSEEEVTECFASIVADAGPLDLADVLVNVKELGNERKEFVLDRSTEERPV